QEQNRHDGEPDSSEPHRPITVSVTVALYRPGATAGRGAVKPRLVGQTSPAPALGAAVVPTSRSGAGAIGIATFVPPPSWPLFGAEAAAIPSGRSAGANADLCTARA